MELLEFAAERRAAAPLLLSIDISCLFSLYGAQQQTRRTPLLRSNDGTDRQTDGRTDTRHLTVT